MKSNIFQKTLIIAILLFCFLVQNSFGFEMDELFTDDIGQNMERDAYDLIFCDILKFQTDYVDLGGTLSGMEINDFSNSFGSPLWSDPSGGLDPWLYKLFFANNIQILTGSLQHDFVFGLLIPTVFLLLFISFMTSNIFKTGPKLTKLVYLSMFIAAIAGGYYPLIAGIAFSFFGKLLGGFFIFLWIKNIYAALMKPYWESMKVREEVGLTKANKWDRWMSVFFGKTSIIGGPAETAKDYAIASSYYTKGEDGKKKKPTDVIVTDINE